MRLVHPLLLLSAVPVGLAMLWLLRSRGQAGTPGRSCCAVSASR